MGLSPKGAAELERDLKEAHAYIGQMWLAVMRLGEETVEAVQADLRRARARQAAERASASGGKGGPHG